MTLLFPNWVQKWGKKGTLCPFFATFGPKTQFLAQKGEKGRLSGFFRRGFPRPIAGAGPGAPQFWPVFRTSKTRSGISPASIPNLFVSSRPGSGESELRSSKASGLVPELQMIAGQERSRIFDSHAAIAFRDANSAARARIFRRNRGSGGFETRFGGKSELIWALKLQV